MGSHVTLPYLRTLCGRTMAWKVLGRTEEATQQAKKLPKLNPRDNQGKRQLLCNWFLELGDTERTVNLSSDDVYSYVLLQSLRWKKDEKIENDVEKIRSKALKANPFVPALFLIDDFNEIFLNFLDHGLREAQLYANEGYNVWMKHSDTFPWLRASQFVSRIRHDKV